MTIEFVGSSLNEFVFLQLLGPFSNVPRRKNLTPPRRSWSKDLNDCTHGGEERRKPWENDRAVAADRLIRPGWTMVLKSQEFGAKLNAR